MGIGDNSTVSITIQVLDNNSGTAIQNVETRLVGLGAAGQTAAAGMSSTTKQMLGFSDALIQVGAAGTKADASLGVLHAQALQMQQAMTAVTAQSIETAAALNGVAEAAQRSGTSVASSFTHTGSSIQGVRLAVQELGLRVPRAMESMIAGNATLAAGLSATMGIFVAMGAVAIFVQMAKEVHDLYDNWISIDSALDKYDESVRNASQEDIVNVRSLEDAEMRLHDINAQVTNLRDLAQQMQHGAWADLFSNLTKQGTVGLATSAGELLIGHHAAGESATAAEQGDKLTQEQIKDQHELNLAKIDAQHAGDAALGTEGKITAELQKQLAIHQEDQRYAHQQDLSLGNKSAPDSGAQLRAQQDAQARAAAAAQETLIARKETDEVTQMYNQAADAGLRGDALYATQREQSIDVVKRKFAEGELSKQAMLQETAAIDMKFDNEALMRLQERERETQKMQLQADTAGLTGLAKIQAEGNISTFDVTSNPDLDENTKQQRRVILEQETDQKIAEAHSQFVQQIAQIDQRSDQNQQTGYAKVEADTDRMLGELAKKFQEYAGQLNPFDPAQMALIFQATQDVASGVNNILSNAARERQRLDQQTNEQIAQTEAEAARAVLPPWEAAEQNIVDQYNQRVQKLKVALDQELAYEKLSAADREKLWQQYNQQVAADAQLAQSQMQKRLQQTRDQMASQIESLFNDPGNYLKKKGEDLMFQLLANWLTQLMQFNSTAKGVLGWLFGQGPQMSTSSNPVTAIGSVFGIGGHGGGNWANGGESLGLPTNLAGGAAGTTSLAAAGTALDSAGTTLSGAGATLSSSGTTLSSSGSQLIDAAVQLMQAAVQLQASASSGGSGGSGGVSQLLNSFGLGDGNNGGDGGGGSGDFWTESGTAGLSGAGGLSGGLASTGDALGPLGAGDITSGTGAVIPPDSVPSNPVELPSVLDSAGGLGKGIGIAGAAIGGGFALAQEWKAGNTGGAVLTGALTGSSIGGTIGSFFGPAGTLIGAGIGAAAGALVGFIGSLFHHDDHGLGKAKQYDYSTVRPAIAQDTSQYDAGQLSYDQASKDLRDLSTKAQSDTKGFGSAAVTYYTNTIVPEIQAAQVNFDRLEKSGRSSIAFSAAQFHAGGAINDFGDLWTSPTTGFIHAELGERVMSRPASLMHGSTLDSLNSGLSLSQLASYVQGSSRSSRSGGGPSGGPVTVVLQAWDGASVDRWLRGGGAQKLQVALNNNVGSYSGKAGAPLG